MHCPIIAPRPSHLHAASSYHQRGPAAAAPPCIHHELKPPKSYVASFRFLAGCGGGSSAFLGGEKLGQTGTFGVCSYHRCGCADYAYSLSSVHELTATTNRHVQRRGGTEFENRMDQSESVNPVTDRSHVSLLSRHCNCSHRHVSGAHFRHVGHWSSIRAMRRRFPIDPSDQTVAPRARPAHVFACAAAAAAAGPGARYFPTPSRRGRSGPRTAPPAFVAAPEAALEPVSARSRSASSSLRRANCGQTVVTGTDKLSQAGILSPLHLPSLSHRAQPQLETRTDNYYLHITAGADRSLVDLESLNAFSGCSQWRYMTTRETQTGDAIQVHEMQQTCSGTDANSPHRAIRQPSAPATAAPVALASRMPLSLTDLATGSTSPSSVSPFRRPPGSPYPVWTETSHAELTSSLAS